MKNTAITDDMISEVKGLQKYKISLFQIENEELKELINDYCIYKQQIMNGNFAQFCLIYINLIHHSLTKIVDRAL